MNSVTSSQSRSRPHFTAWLHVALIFLFMLVNFADKSVIGLSSVPIMRELHLSNTQFGELGSAFFLLFSLSGLAGGFLANHVRTTTLLGAMAVTWGLALLPMRWVSSFGVLLASRIALGAAEGPAFPVALHAVYKWFGDRQRALPTSIVACGAAFGTGVIAPLVTWVITHAGWHDAFGLLGACGLAWAAAWFALAQDGPVDAAAPSMADSSERAQARPAVRVPLWVAYRRLLLSRTFVGVVLAGFGAYGLISLNITWLANYLIKVCHVAPANAAWIVGLPSVMQMLLAPSMALLSQRLMMHGVSSRVARGVLGALCVVAAGLSLAVMAFLTMGPLKVLLIGLGFSAGSIIFTLGSTLIGEIAPASQRGALLGITNSVQTLAGLCAPLIMGMIVDSAADPQAGFRIGYASAGALVAVLGLAAALLIDPRADRRRFVTLEGGKPR